MENETNNVVRFIKWGAIGLSLLVVISLFFGLIGSNNDQEWQAIQYPNGSVEVRDTAGYYPRYFGSVWTYPRNAQVEYDKEFAFSVTFNDASTAKMNAMLRFSSPPTLEMKREFHRQFGGNMENVEAAVWAHLSNAIKATGPIMSSSEHQSARQSEFNQLVYEQLNNGLFETRKIQKMLHDQFDDKGKPITVWATEVVNDDKGQPRIANQSPLAKLGIVVTQFSITHVEYDEATKKQFSQKKDAFLAAENSKAQREKEVQERLMVEERGRREKAEAEAMALKQKAKEVIDAERLKQVAELDAQRAKNVAEMDAIRNKVVAETDAAKLLAVAQLDKQRAETDAAKQLEVAKLERQAAEENAQKQIALAKAQEESLKIAGAISERDRVLAEIEKEKAIGVAQHLAKVGVPSFIINGGADAKDGNSTSVNDQLMNVFLLKQMGVLKQ